jgi:ketosteroid isomerase-like protein
MNSSDEAAVISVYEAWCRAFQSMDAVAMKALFEKNSDGLTYQSEENIDPLYTWQEIDDYWSAAPAIVDRIPEWRELTRKVAVYGDTAFVFTKLHTHLEVKGAKKSLIGELRVSIGMHRTPHGWKIVHYHESRHLDLAYLFTD